MEEYNSLTGEYIEVEKSGNALWPSISGRVIKSGDSESDDGRFEKSIPIFISKADEQIVSGIVYEPDVEDAQGDSANAAEIQKAAFDFMQSVQTFKVNHKGRKTNIAILESYVAPTDFTVGKRKVKKGSWVITAKVNDKKIWEDIKAGKLTGFSMAGHARVA